LTINKFAEEKKVQETQRGKTNALSPKRKSKEIYKSLINDVRKKTILLRTYATLKEGHFFLKTA